MLFDTSQGSIFVYIQRCHSQCWLCKLCISFENFLVEDKYLYYGICKNDFGLYRDDGLAVLKNKSGPQSEQVKKNIQKIFKDHENFISYKRTKNKWLDIIIQCNMKIANYLDVTFNLKD